MRLKWFLIIAPVVLSIILLQSYFWVPTYEAQTTGNPARMWKFIEASIGDAKILNPALQADSASSKISGLVFEGLLDLDENLKLRGRLAKNWRISEEAYLLVNTAQRFPDGVPVSSQALLERIRAGMASGALEDLKKNLINIKIVSRETRTQTISVPGPNGKPNTVRVRLHIPERLQFSLQQVDQDFFQRLTPVIGKAYVQSAPREEWFEVDKPELRAPVRAMLPELLPVLEHNPVILFNLRQGVHFHDGEEFDAQDVKFTYEAIMAPKNLSPRTSDFEPIKQVEVLDPYTVRIVYKRLFSPAIDAWVMGILPEHLLNEQALAREMDRRGLSESARASFGVRDSEFNRQPIGTGPFRFVEWQSDEYIHLARNDDYWEGPPQYKDYYYRIIPDTLTQEVEFRTGAVDTYGPEPHQVARYRQDDRYQSFSSPGFSFTYIGYNNRRPLLADKRVRRALGMALNVDEVIRYVLYGEGQRTTGPFPINTDWYNRGVEPLAYDPQGALRILEGLGWKKNQAGWLEKDGKIFELNLITNNGNLIRKAIMTVAQNHWRKIGIKCNTQLFEWAVFLKDFINTGDFDAVILGWSMGIDPDLYQIWHSSQSGPNQLNFVGYKNPQADDLILRIRQEYNPATQRKLTHRLHEIIAADQPYTFLFAPMVTQVLDKKIVVAQADGGYSKVEPTRSGSIFFYFNRWRKLAFTPEY